ncbi:MAG: hypothetical protein AAF264_12260, partial [Pseudomonadota bacterium]
GVQTHAALILTVPADRVQATAAYLTKTTGMVPTRFVCCGYEPMVGEAGTLPRGADSGAFPRAEVYVTMTAPDIETTSFTEILSLGDRPATLLLLLMEI